MSSRNIETSLDSSYSILSFDGLMDDDAFYEKIQDLSDLELAALICLVNEEHCIIHTTPEAIDDTFHELRLITSNIFGLTHATLECTPSTTIDDFTGSILIDEAPTSLASSPQSLYRSLDSSYFLRPPPLPTFRTASRSPLSLSERIDLDDKYIANVIIAKNLDVAPKQVQIQVLELLRSKRMFTHTSVKTAPKKFLFITLITGGEGPRLTPHLNDHIFLSHYHYQDDGFPNLEEEEGGGEGTSGRDSISSMIRKRGSGKGLLAKEPAISIVAIDALVQAIEKVTVTVEITRYMRNIVVFLRLHRAVHGGISPVATKCFDKLVKSAEPTHQVLHMRY